MNAERAGSNPQEAGEPAAVTDRTLPYPPIPRWAWALSAGLAAGSVLVFALGRGGTAVLAGAVLGLGALLSLLLSVPDGDPAGDA